MSALSSKKTDSYGKDSFDDDLSDSLIEAEELDLDNDSTFEDDEIIAAALDFYDSNFKLSKFIESKENGKELSNDDEDEENDDLNKTSMPELPEINFDNIDLDPQQKPALSGEASCEEIDPEEDEESQVSDNDDKQDNRNDKLSTNRSITNSSETGNSIEIKISSRRPSSFNSDTRYSYSFEGKESSSSIPKKANSRLNLSFSNDRVREIERHNKILLQKIMAKKPTIEAKKKPNTNSNINNKNKNKSAHESFLFNRTASAAINRKKEQNKIDYENQILKRKLEAIALGKRKNRLS